MRAVVLVGDGVDDRFNALAKAISSEFVVDVQRARTFDELRAQVSGGAESVKLVLMSIDFPYSHVHAKPLLDRYVMDLRSTVQVLPIGFLFFGGGELPRLTDENAQGILFIEFPPQQPDELRQQLHPILRRYSVLPKIHLVGGSALENAVRSVSDENDLAEGERVLGQLVGRLFSWKQCYVSHLGPGFSGAMVFRICESRESTPQFPEYLLKICGPGGRWKLREELRRHVVAPAGNAYSRHLPNLVKPRVPDSDNEVSVSYGSWSAICFDFLGGPNFGRMIDLYGLITMPAEAILSKVRGTPHARDEDITDADDLRISLVEELIDWLNRHWYMAPGRATRTLKRLWTAQDEIPRQYADRPPYGLSRSSKAQIENFLDSDGERLGRRLNPANWEAEKSRVLDFVRAKETTGLPLLDGVFSVLVCPSHGDLNSKNVLLWLEERAHPFLVDFPMYQEAGHALQDFARLEVEFKLILMDRQEDSPGDRLPALDLTWSQMALWRSLEGHLRSANWSDPIALPDEGFAKNVRLTFRLVHLVRVMAARAHQQSMLGASEVLDFLDEYRPALLFHTLLIASFPDVSIFKRLLAVHAAALLLEDLAIGQRGRSAMAAG